MSSEKNLCITNIELEQYQSRLKQAVHGISFASFIRRSPRDGDRKKEGESSLLIFLTRGPLLGRLPRLVYVVLSLSCDCYLSIYSEYFIPSLGDREHRVASFKR